MEIDWERAAREGADARFLVGDATGLPLPDAGFDAAVSAFGVIFASDAAAAVDEMLRVIRAGGVVALTSWRASGPSSRPAGCCGRRSPPARGRSPAGTTPGGSAGCWPSAARATRG